MKKLLKKLLLWLLALVAVVLVFGLILSFLPSPLKVHHQGISPEKAAELRADFSGPYHTFTTSDGETLFIRRWDPDTLEAGKEDIAVLIFHGLTAYSGAYEMAAIPFSEGGYTTFGLDYRGHGLSDGNRGDSPNKERWIADLEESVEFVKSLGFQRVVVLGHSLGVAAAMCVAETIPEELVGVVLLSGAYEGKTGNAIDQISFFQKMRILATAIFRPSHQAFEYYRDGMLGINDPLFNYKYTVRFLTMLDVKQLRIPENLKTPVLVGVGDQDELFDVDKVLEFYDLIPGNNKEFLVWKGATHAEIGREHWEQIVKWLDRSF
ncbi:MAG: alpha/beta fold hydrolase [Prolixibacteraceae bacterium]|nr:alpha/beta fold hydrolase [Prolixibacteraceae bacterium]